MLSSQCWNNSSFAFLLEFLEIRLSDGLFSIIIHFLLRSCAMMLNVFGGSILIHRQDCLLGWGNGGKAFRSLLQQWLLFVGLSTWFAFWLDTTIFLKYASCHLQLYRASKFTGSIPPFFFMVQYYIYCSICWLWCLWVLSWRESWDLSVSCS